MHIRLTDRAVVCGQLVAAGTVLDLPEHEAKPLLEDGVAELLAPMLPEPKPEPVYQTDEDGNPLLDADGKPIPVPPPE